MKYVILSDRMQPRKATPCVFVHVFMTQHSGDFLFWI